MEKYTSSLVIVFHDETKKDIGRNLKGHVLLFVPITLFSITRTPFFGLDSVDYSPLDQLSSALRELRQNTKYQERFHFSEVCGKKWDRSALAHYLAIELAVDALRSKGQKLFKYPLHCKLALMFYPAEFDHNIYGGETRKERIMRHDETILRILLKGAAHYLYDERNRIEIANIVADGQPQHRKMSEERVIAQLTREDLSGRVQLRDYVAFAADSAILHLPSDHRQHLEGSDEYKQAQMLQLADLLLGAALRACFTGLTRVSKVPRKGDICIKKDVLALPVKKLLDKRQRRGGFVNSGHFKSFTISWVEFSNGSVNFREIESHQFRLKNDKLRQLEFPSSSGA